jgi:hypothetical protein
VYLQPTQAQRRQLDLIRREFGNALKGGYHINPHNGRMRVRLQAAAGEWIWWFDVDGILADKQFTYTQETITVEPLSIADAMRAPCPKCGAKPNFLCETASGEPTDNIHRARYREVGFVRATPADANRGAT